MQCQYIMKPICSSEYSTIGTLTFQRSARKQEHFHAMFINPFRELELFAVMPVSV